MVPFLTPFLVGRVPLPKKTTEKVGTLILTSPLEDLVYNTLTTPWHLTDTVSLEEVDLPGPPHRCLLLVGGRVYEHVYAYIGRQNKKCIKINAMTRHTEYMQSHVYWCAYEKVRVWLA